MKINEQHIAILNALNTNSEFYFTFNRLNDITGLDRRLIRRLIRALAREGYAEYSNGLSTEDGELAGSGYCITEQGIKYLNA